MSFSESAHQALLELIERGVSDSAGKLATASRTEWKTETVSIRSATMDGLMTVLAGDKADHAGALFSMQGGTFVVMFTQGSTKALSKAFLPEKGGGAPPDLEKESIAEISNIVVHCVANVIGDACDEVLFVSAPEMTQGKKADLLKLAAGKFKAQDEASAIVAYINLYSVALSSDCTIVLLLNSVWRNRLLQALDV